MPRRRQRAASTRERIGWPATLPKGDRALVAFPAGHACKNWQMSIRQIVEFAELIESSREIEIRNVYGFALPCRRSTGSRSRKGGRGNLGKAAINGEFVGQHARAHRLACDTARKGDRSLAGFPAGAPFPDVPIWNFGEILSRNPRNLGDRFGGTIDNGFAPTFAANRSSFVTVA